MGRKLILLISLLTFTFVLTSCGPSNIEVGFIDVTCGPGTVAVGDYLDLSVTIDPIDATNQGYDLVIDDYNILDFSGSLQVQGISVGHVWITITSHDVGHTNSCDVVVTD